MFFTSISNNKQWYLKQDKEKLYSVYLHHKTAAALLSMQEHKGDMVRKNMTMTFKNRIEKEG